MNAFNSDYFFDAESLQVRRHDYYADAMSRPDAKLWKEAFDKEMNVLVQCKVINVVERPANRFDFGEIGRRKALISLTRYSLQSLTIAK